MKRLSESQLINEVKARFRENQRNLDGLKDVMVQLQDVNQKLSESEALKSHFLSNIRNEINNPLTAILGLAENILSEDAESLENIHAMARMIHQEADNLDFQLRSIFAAAEIEAGEAHLHISKVDVNALINRVIETLHQCPEAKNVNVEFVNDIVVESGKIFLFKTDPEKFHLIISHLLSNAIEFGHEGNHIQIKASQGNGELLITVQDSGIGIDKADHERIFDRFVQLDEGVTKRYKGHGLGLSVTKSAVELLNGSISLVSEAGNGSLFSVKIPEADPALESGLYTADGNAELF